MTDKVSCGLEGTQETQQVKTRGRIRDWILQKEKDLSGRTDESEGLWLVSVSNTRLNPQALALPYQGCLGCR